MALVRVYCGLASAEQAESQQGSEIWLTVAVVDDAGRLLDICEVSDDAGGYAELSALLAQRSGGQSGVAVAADSDDHVVTQLLSATGRALAYTDDDSADDYAERFADDESPEEIQSNAAERRAVGLARALQAGVLSAVGHATPRDMLALKPVLAAHAAVVSGRQGTAATLREVLRELYPAALRAYPDPAEAIPLAVLDALPEPGILGAGTTSRGRDAQVIADLAATGVADASTLGEAITALRVAIAETPRRTGVNRALTAAVAETIRQSVAAVRASDAAAAALVGVLAERMNGGHTRSTTKHRPSTPLRPVPEPAPAPTRASRAAAASTPPPAAAASAGPRRAAPAEPVAPATEPAAARAVGGRRRAQAQPESPAASATTTHIPAVRFVPPAPPPAAPPQPAPAQPVAPAASHQPATSHQPAPFAQPAAAAMQSIPMPVQQPPAPIQRPPAQPMPVAPLPTAPPPIAPPPVAPAPVIPPPMAPAASMRTSEPTTGSLTPPPPPPGIAPLGTAHVTGGFPQVSGTGGFPPAASSTGGFPPVGSSTGNFPPASSSTGGFPPVGSSTGGFPPVARSTGGFPQVPEPRTEPKGFGYDTTTTRDVLAGPRHSAPAGRGADELPSLAPAAVPPPPYNDNTGSFGLLGDLNPAPRLDPATPPPGSRASWALNGEEPTTAYNADPMSAPRASEGRRITAIPRLSDMPREPQPPRDADLPREPGLLREPGLSRAPGLSREPGLSRAPGLSREPGFSREQGLSRDGGHSRDAGLSRDGGFSRDSGHSRDSGLSRDGGSSRDGGLPRRGDHSLNGSSSDTMPLLNGAPRDPLPTRNGASSFDGPDLSLPRQREGRVTPPWQADDLPVEPPGLRLVEPAPLTDPALSAERTYADELSGEFRLDPPPLRLVEPEQSADRGSRGRGRRSAERLDTTPVPPPVNDEGDGDLLIFAAARSAWFTDYDSEETAAAEVSWGASDVGWRAAEQASQPQIGDETTSGLPRRVPQQNLVPGSPVSAPERPLRIVRDAAAIAAHTTGYFRGWRRGQEVGGYSVGGRPGREQAGGWDFTRETSSREYEEREYEYRSARR